MRRTLFGDVYASSFTDPSRASIYLIPFFSHFFFQDNSPPTLSIILVVNCRLRRGRRDFHSSSRVTQDVLKARGLSSENKDKWAERRVGGGQAGEEGIGEGGGLWIRLCPRALFIICLSLRPSFSSSSSVAGAVETCVRRRAKSLRAPAGSVPRYL